VVQRQDKPLGKILLEIWMKAGALDRVLNEWQRAEQPFGAPFAAMRDESRFAFEMRARPERLYRLLWVRTSGSCRRETVELEEVARQAAQGARSFGA
jgi:hypothetical protein